MSVGSGTRGILEPEGGGSWATGHGIPSTLVPPLRGSVLIPAHNEEEVISRCLAVIGAPHPDDDLEVIVVCNGCTDRTAAVARAAAPWAHVVEIPQASKTEALNAGESWATRFPRFYVDADVEVSRTALSRVADQLMSGEVLAAAPHLRIDDAQSSWPVRAYMRMWSRLPYAKQNLVGAGFFALSEEGRARFGRFPHVVADDMFVHGLFAVGERRALADVDYVSHAPHRVSSLLSRLARAYAGNLQLRRVGLPGGTPVNGPVAIAHLLRREPTAAVDGLVFIAVSLTGKLLARWKVFNGATHVWNRDDSSRHPAPGLVDHRPHIAPSSVKD